MKPIWLALDMHNLAYRAVHSTGYLRYGDLETGVCFGILREVIQLQEQFQTKNICFCFDLGAPKRKEEFPGYKQGRHYTDDLREKRRAVRKQLRAMRNGYLQNIGFRNILYQKGYEADDIMGSLVIDHDDKRFVLVSEDKDLFQLLALDDVRIYQPRMKAVLSADWFTDKYGIEPLQWIDVESISGGHNGLEGIKGIGPITAIKFLQGKLDPNSKAAEKIVLGNRIWRRNQPLVQLPYKGIKSFKLVEDEVTNKKWRKALTSLGMSSLIRMLGLEKKTSFSREDFR